MSSFDVYYANVKYEDDKSQSKERPIIYIVSSNDNTSQVYKVTSVKHPELKQYEIKDLDKAGLNKASYVDLEKTYILNNNDIEFTKLKGHLSPVDIGALVDAVILNSTLNNVVDLTQESLGEDMEEDTRLILPEDDEEVLPEVVLEEPLEVEISQEDLDQALMSQYNNEISNIYNDIDNLNSILVSFDSLDEETKKTIEGIIEERYIHIGLLQSLANDLDPKIKELIDDGEVVSDEEDDREILPEDDLEEDFDYTKGHFPVCDSEDDDNDFWNNVYLRSH